MRKENAEGVRKERYYMDRGTPVSERYKLAEGSLEIVKPGKGKETIKRDEAE